MGLYPPMLLKENLVWRRLGGSAGSDQLLISTQFMTSGLWDQVPHLAWHSAGSLLEILSLSLSLTHTPSSLSKKKKRKKEKRGRKEEKRERKRKNLVWLTKYISPLVEELMAQHLTGVVSECLYRRSSTEITLQNLWVFSEYPLPAL